MKLQNNYIRLLLILLVIGVSIYSKNCNLNSHIVAIDKVISPSYDMLLTLSTDDECNVSCDLLDIPN